MKKVIATTLCFFCLFGASLSARAVDSVSFEVGGGDDANLARVGVQWDWDKKWFEGGDWTLGGYWDLSLGYWSGDGGASGGDKNITDIGFTPVFRFRQNNTNGAAVYFEGAVGFHLLSDSRVHASKDLGSDFEFGDHIGAGVLFGDRQQYDFSYRFQHLSDAGISDKNLGVNFHQLRFPYHF